MSDHRNSPRTADPQQVDNATRGANGIDDEIEQGVELLPIINLFLRHRMEILKPAVLLAVVVGLLSLLMPSTYTATAKFISSGNPGSSSVGAAGPGVAQRVGSNVDMSTIDGMPEYYEALLQSSDFLKAALRRKYSKRDDPPSQWMVDELGEEAADEGHLDLLANKLKGQISITTAKSSSPRTTILVLNVTGNEPGQVAALANDLLDELSAYGGHARMQKAIKDRDFIQGRLDETEAKLRQDEAALANFSMRNRKIVTPDLENEKTRLQRSVTIQEELFLTLKKQLELAKVGVQENVSVLQILEQPNANKTGPKRLKYLVLAFVLGVLVFWAKYYFINWFHRIDEKDSEVNELVTHLLEIRDDLLKSFRCFKRNIGGISGASIRHLYGYFKKLIKIRPL